MSKFSFAKSTILEVPVTQCDIERCIKRGNGRLFKIIDERAQHRRWIIYFQIFDASLRPPRDIEITWDVPIFNPITGAMLTMQELRAVWRGAYRGIHASFVQLEYGIKTPAQVFHPYIYNSSSGLTLFQSSKALKLIA